MAEQTGLVVRYTAPPSASLRESRWIRLEPLQPEGESLTLEEAASAIDELFGIEPCEQGLGGGGGATEYNDEDGLPEDRPDEERFDETMRNLMGAELCEQGKHWFAELLVLRSHRAPSYNLRSESAELVRTELVRKRVQESVDFGGGTSADLGWPYAGGLSGIPAGIEARVLGSTVNLSAPAYHLTLSYSSEYEQVRLRVPVVEQPETDGQDRLQRPELPEAAVVAFWGDLAAACELSPPAQDGRASQDEIDRLCRGPRSRWQLGGPTECFETIEHYNLCNCSRKRTNTWREVVAASCPEGVPPGTYYLGTRQQFEGYVTCPGEEDEVNEPWFYEAKCCWPPTKPLPRCRRIYALYRGGAEIEGGPQRWFDTYGPNTRLIPVSPPGGICGEHITEWDIRSENCCDRAPELGIDHNVSVTVMTDNSEAYVGITGGLGPYTWTTSSPGLYIGSVGQRRYTGNSGRVRLVSTDICGMLAVTITDSCSQSVTHEFKATRGQWVYVNPGDVGNCLHGGSAPEFWGNDPQGPKWVSYRGDLRMVFSWTTPNSITGDPGNCQSICAGTAGPGGRFDNCGIVGLVNKIEYAPIHGITKWRCYCNGFSNKRFHRWRC